MSEVTPRPGVVFTDPGPLGPEPHDAVPGKVRNVSGQTLYLSEIDRNVEDDSIAVVADVTGYAHQPAWEVVVEDAPAKADPAPAKPVFQTADKFTEPTPDAAAPVEK